MNIILVLHTSHVLAIIFVNFHSDVSTPMFFNSLASFPLVLNMKERPGGFSEVSSNHNSSGQV